MTHRLKTWPVFFKDVINGRKPFEVRKNDRLFSVGDTLLLEEWSPDTKNYTGRSITVTVTYVLGQDIHLGIMTGFVVMGLDVPIQKQLL